MELQHGTGFKCPLGHFLSYNSFFFAARVNISGISVASKVQLMLVLILAISVLPPHCFDSNRKEPVAPDRVCFPNYFIFQKGEWEGRVR